MSVSLSVQGAEDIDELLAKLHGRAKDATPAWSRIADDFARSEARIFATRSAGGAPWASLAPRYARRKAKKYPGKGPLVASGALRASLTRRPLGVELISAHEVILGTDKYWGRFQRPRRFIWVSPAQMREWTDTLERFLLTGDPGAAR